MSQARAPKSLRRKRQCREMYSSILSTSGPHLSLASSSCGLHSWSNTPSLRNAILSCHCSHAVEQGRIPTPSTQRVQGAASVMCHALRAAPCTEDCHATTSQQSTMGPVDRLPYWPDGVGRQGTRLQVPRRRRWAGGAGARSGLAVSSAAKTIVLLQGCIIANERQRLVDAKRRLVSADADDADEEVV